MTMKLQVTVTIICLLILKSIYAQDRLFFLKATPVDDPYVFSDDIPAALLLFNKDSIKFNEVVKLTTYENRVKDIRYYYESKRIVISKEAKKTYEENLYVINTDKFDSLIYQPIICPKYYVYSEFKVIKENDKPFLCIACFNNDVEEFEILKSYSFIDSSKKEFGSNDYKRILLSGSAYFLQRNDYQDIYTEPTNGNIKIPVVSNINERPIFPLVIPDSLQIGKKEHILILINNKSQFVLNANSTKFVSNQIGSSTFIIYDYDSKKWYKQKIKGNYASINSYGNWLAGVVYDYAGMNESIFKESPGKGLRTTLKSKNEFNADKRFAYFNIYSPGILYLFNTLTQKYIEWNTNQGDSEILLLENDTVYYRVNDEIYKAPILKGEKLGKSELLIKDQQVLDIHWAFISK